MSETFVVPIHIGRFSLKLKRFYANEKHVESIFTLILNVVRLICDLQIINPYRGL